jgi:glycolate oxidase
MEGLKEVDISTDKEDLLCYSFDASIYKGKLPYAIAWPKNTEDVIKIVRFANEKNLFIIPRGAGTGMTGAAVAPIERCLIISFEKMKKILDIDTKNMTVTVQPGIINSKLQKELESLGFFYPPDPASMNMCTIGGNVATNAGGPRAIKYGVTRDYVMAIEAVLSNGKIIDVGGKTYKKVVGYDLKNLLIGSEGTLAIATKIRLKMLPLPEDVIALLALFNNIEAAAVAVPKIINSKIIPRTIEFMDRFSIEAIENYKPLGLPADTEALLLIELDGYPFTIKREAEKIADICQGLGAETVVAEDSLARERLWEARRSLSPALYHISPNKISEDIVVPRDKISSLIKELKRISEENNIKIICFGHAGDGNIHVNIMIDKTNNEELKKGLNLIEKIFEITINLGGSISGEHGIGITKAPYINLELKEKEIQIMKEIKKIFDHKGILNPCKIFPAKK